MERKWLILTSVSLGSLMATLDGSIVNIALPAIQNDFRIDLTTVEWVVVAYHAGRADRVARNRRRWHGPRVRSSAVRRAGQRASARCG